VYSAPGTWDAPDPDMAYLGVYDGHGGESALLVVVVWSVIRSSPNSLITLYADLQAEIWSNIWSMACNIM
jgi:hypothetical protein